MRFVSFLIVLYLLNEFTFESKSLYKILRRNQLYNNERIIAKSPEERRGKPDWT